MSRQTVYLIILVLCMVQLDCEVYNSRPKIKTFNGDLILEPAYGKNIYIQPHGPKSTVFIGEQDIAKLSSKISNDRPNDVVIQNDVGNVQDLQRRIDKLESQVLSLPINTFLNVSILSRRINRLNNAVRDLHSTLHSITENECQSHPCENGGTCLNLATGYYCLCPSTWKGRNCDEDVNECRNYAGTDLGCQNGATCINRPGSYECICKSNWYGLHCTKKSKDCSAGDYEMCGHGTCIPITSGEGIKCICDQGWTTNGTGPACLTDVNECESGQGARCSVIPKVKCINLPGSFRCEQCPVGYEGDGFACYDIDECMTIPNGGCSTSPMVSCHNTIGSRICGSCPPGFQGDGITCTWRGSCSTNHGGCHPSAQCIESPVLSGQMVQCICPHGMAGDGIGIHGCYVEAKANLTQSCDNNPCGSHGQCLLLRSGYTCICYHGYGGMHCEMPSDYCVSNPCRNGGTCRPDERAARGFRCECTALHTGGLCQFNSEPCGGVINAEQGSLIYPSSNTTYMPNSRCAWVIHTSSDKVINVTFSKFNLEYDSECHNDFVQIHDGRSSASQLIGRFCGNNFPKGGNIISSHNNLYFWFRSDQSVARDGFALHWVSMPPKCGGEVDATSYGHLSSPGSPGTYPPNRDCYWHLSTTLGKRIQIHFFQLDIEVHSNCSFDYVAIYDGEHSYDPLIGKYCSTTQPPPIESTGSEVLIHFHSDEKGDGHGFQIAYAPTEGVPGCGGIFTNDKGEITSPSYDGKYLNNLLCEYKIKVRQDMKIRVEFKKFNLEKSLTCRYDSLKIYDGPSSDSRLVGNFCGNILPNSFVSTSNSIFFIFKTDQSMSSEGFKIKYDTVCLKHLTGDSGFITSPGYPIVYPKRTVCEYIISTTPGKAIQLTFQDFDIEDNRYYDCQYDSVEIHDGHSVNSTLMGRFCGGPEHTPSMQVSSYNYLYIKFNSDLSVTGRGFYANFTTVDIECGGVYRNNTGLINHPKLASQYVNDQSCTWLLLAPVGKHIKLSWSRFDLELMPSCMSDYVELIEIDESNNNNTLGKYCGDRLPPAISTSYNRLMVKFVSDSSIRSNGFSLSYSFLDDAAHCDRVYVKSHGYIYSPGWPNLYPANRDCIWIITVPIGQQVMINITDFDLERPLRGKCDLGDYLLIRDGANEKSPIIGKYCGSFKSQRVVSTSNSIFLQFHSDFYLAGKGFQIEWDGSIFGCGGTLSNAKGSLSSPNYPQHYNENAECFYKIVTSSGSRIRIKFTELDLERTTNCSDDYVEIFDGRDSNSRSYGKYCFLTNTISNIETTANYAFIIFRSDVFLSGKGFLLNYETICNNNVSGRYGVIESPGFPNVYPLNLNCLWTITVPRGNTINVTFTHFDLVYRNFYHSRFATIVRPVHRTNYVQCDSDYIQYKDTSSKNFSKKLCGIILPDPISSTSNSLQIKFASGSFFARTGFRLEWLSYGCGGHIQKRSGNINLDNIKNSKAEIECEWLLETPFGTAVSVTISDLLITENKNCSIDAIEIYNGQSSDYPLLARTCHRGTTVVRASSNFMLVKLVKQSSLRDIYFKANFDSFKASCGGNIEAKSGFIYSKNYPHNYENNLDCSWLITVPKNHKIEFSLIDFDLYGNEDEDDCNDSIRIYDGHDMSGGNNYTHKVCPNSNNTRYISDYSTMMVKFVTNSYGTAKGFKGKFTMICGAVINAVYDGVISNDNSISHLNGSCTWTVISPNFSKIKLTITHMNLPRNTDIITNRHCPSSFLRVFEGTDEKSSLIGEYCGHKVPSTIVSRGSALTLQLGTYADIIVGQFQAYYSNILTACGGSLSSEEGDIASLNYPQSYPINSNCEWILSTSPGNRVYITFEDFDLDYSENCNEDYLEIREDNGGGKLLAVYCGHEIPSNMTTGTKLYIKFHSDHLKTGRGFLLHYGFLHGNDIIGLQSGAVSSPLYPHLYETQGEYTWRITVSDVKIIILNIDHLEIKKTGELCTNKLIIYDGYDEDAPVLEEMCGILKNGEKTLKSSSSVAFIKLSLDDTNTGSGFHINWAESDKNIEDINERNKANCGTNITQLVSSHKDVTFQSPNYPKNYGSDQNCLWTFQSDVGNHLSIQFEDLTLEETSGCFADYISIYTSDNQIQWYPVEEHICLSENKSQKFESSTFMKVIFKSDSSVSRKGFQALISSKCGGTILETSGLIEMNTLDQRKLGTQTCEWIIKVRPGHSVKMSFEYFNITNSDNCNTYVILKNGGSSESPLLGKYCGYPQENRTNILSSSNYVFVKYLTKYLPHYAIQTFRLRYEEMNIECGTTSKLDINHSWEIISSPMYPSVPVPFTECVWVFTGPPGEILRVDFIDRFDLEVSDNCVKEFVEIRDGSTRLSPLKGTFCGDRPSTIKTSSNTIFIMYSTQLVEPRNGFKANVSIDVCGGTTISRSGEIISPNYPRMPGLPVGIVCQWQIISLQRHIIKIEFKDINLPESEEPCGTRITIEEVVPSNGSLETQLIKEFCSDELFDDTKSIESVTNKVTIKLHVGKPSQWAHIVESRGFKLTFDSSRLSCGGIIRASEGFLTTPGYPRQTSIRFCQWTIIVPDESRRVKLEIIDWTGDHDIAAYNDNTFSSGIDAYVDSTNSSQTFRIYKSIGNKLSFYIWPKTPSNKLAHRFKAQFSSHEPSLCGGSLNGLSGELKSPDLIQSYVCEWKFTNVGNEVRNNSTNLYNTIFVTVNISSLSTTKTICRYRDSRLNLNTNVVESSTFVRNICGNNTQVSFKMPNSMMNIKAIQYKHDPLYFNLKWKLQPCGGIFYATKDPTNILIIPEHLSDTIYCSWVLISSNNERVELKLEGLFNLDCFDEFLKISQGLSQSSLEVADYCKDKLPENSFSSTYTHTYIQYQSKPQNVTKIKLIVKTLDSVCGGYLTQFKKVFTSPNYPQNYQSNQECTWEIVADLGFRVSLQFIDRFAIEVTRNCTKDVLIVYDWKNNKYVELARLCGRNLPQAINSTFNKMKVLFRSDATITLDGFKAKWSPLCGGKFVAIEKEQFLYSPGYNYEYRPSLVCEYEISAPSNRVSIKFLSFELEGPYPECKYDNLSIIASNDYNYLYNIYCGKEVPATLNSFETVKLIFMTDKFGQRRGFKLAYSTYSCGGKITEPTLLALELADSYGDYKNCTWTIETSENKIIVLNFINIDIESNYECGSDNLDIFDGNIINVNKRLARLCGHINSTTTVRTNSNKAVVQFVSESYYDSKGFKAKVTFSLSSSFGCGGNVNLKNTAYHILKSPLNGNFNTYDNYLDCYWNIKAPVDHVIKVNFTSFHIATCLNVNQTALGSKCDCDYVEIYDGLNPNSLVIGKFCGHSMPPNLMSSNNVMSIRLVTDGDLSSSGFVAFISSQPSSCGQSVFKVSKLVQRFHSPGYDIATLPRGLHCAYYFDTSQEPYNTVHLSIRNLDLEPASDGKCNSDKLIIHNSAKTENLTVGKNFIWDVDDSNLINYVHFYDETIRLPKKIILCGTRVSVDYYLMGSVNVNLITSPEGTSTHKGVEIEVSYLNFCSRNYTEPQGRIQSNSMSYDEVVTDQDCYVLITAPENFTISIYFMSVSPIYNNENVYLEIFDGNSTSSPLIVKIRKEYSENTPIFSNSQYLLLHNHRHENVATSFDFNYVITDKGRGCGGKLSNELGRITSPLYPNTYRRKATCEWELETPIGTVLRLHFTVFDLGRVCEQNYLTLVDKEGNNISTFCSETPADYTSRDNYIKIVFVTSRNNGGTGWIADFAGIV